jgi:hypothetical protein
MAVEAGTRVGRFVIHEYVGQGDLGLLFRARGPNAGSVAVKVLRSLSSATVRTRFLVLAGRLGGIRHPNLVPVFDFGDHHDTPYLVLQYVPGGSLADLLRASRISQPTVLWVLRGIAAGVDHAHRSGLVHGALKPQQVVLDDDDRPLVTDFGLATLRWPRPDGVTVVVPEANAAYTAPELVTGGQPTAAADRYAYATIAYELLTGRTPFQGEPHDVMNAQLDAEPAAPSSVNPALTPALDAVLLRGLAKDPRSRWPSCAEMAEALAGAISLAGPSPAAVDRREALLAAPAVPGARRRAPGSTAAGANRRLAHWALALGVALLAGALAVGATVTLLAGQPPIVAIVLSSAIVHAGDPLVVTATDLPVDQAGMVELHSDPEQIGTFRADRYGNLRVEVVIPEDAPVGDHLVTLCWEGGCHGSARLTIADAIGPATPTPGGLSGDGGTSRAGPAPAGPAAGTGLPAAPGGPAGAPPPEAAPTPARTPSPRPTSTPSACPGPSPSACPSPSPSACPSPSPKPRDCPGPSPRPGAGPWLSASLVPPPSPSPPDAAAARPRTSRLDPTAWL